MNPKQKTSECEHDIVSPAIGGFPGHEHIHPSGEQFCLDCKKTLSEIISEAEKRGYRTGVFEEAVRLKEAREEALEECLEIINHSIDKTDAYKEINEKLAK